jgi:hypothetical protein
MQRPISSDIQLVTAESFLHEQTHLYVHDLDKNPSNLHLGQITDSAPKNNPRKPRSEIIQNE